LSAEEPPTLVVHGGQIVTVDANFQIVSAMAIRGDRIIATGTDAEMLKLASAETQRLNLEGRMVLPGLIDSHVHAASAAVYEFDHAVPTMQTIEEVLQYIASRASVVPRGEWIVVQQVFVTRLRDQRFPTRQELDRVAPHHPVCFRTGPDASLNSLALKLNGIDRDYQVAEGLPAKIERDPSGEPTGILRNHGRLLKTGSSTASPNPQQRQASLRELLADYNAAGITGIAERNANAATVAQYEALRDEGSLTCRVFLYWGVDPNAPMAEVEAKIREAANHRAHDYDPWVWLRGVKVFLDGGMLTGSAYMREPWGVSQVYAIDDPAYRGLLYIEPERLFQIARMCLQQGLQPTAHAVGDGAVHALLAAYQQVDAEFPVAAGRPCITHANFMSAEAIATMRKLGAVADLQPAWLWLDGTTLNKQFGETRLRYFQPYRTLFDNGVVVGGGSDHMQKIGRLRSVNPYDPFLGLWIALRRVPRGASEPIHDEETISRQQALKLYTINNAYILHDEQNRGSLEPGKLAGFIEIDRDYLNCPIDEVRDIKVLNTFVGGKRVYSQSARTE
ncbi:MAG: amidohydrolase, partial [Planctomycetaceae bacterium]